MSDGFQNLCRRFGCIDTAVYRTSVSPGNAAIIDIGSHGHNAVEGTGDGEKSSTGTRKISLSDEVDKINDAKQRISATTKFDSVVLLRRHVQLPKDRFQFSRLLSGRHRLTVQEKEAVLERVLFESCKEGPTRRSVFGLSGFGLKVAAGAALSLLLLIPAVFILLRDSSGEAQVTDAFYVRGDGGQVPRFSIRCIGGGMQGTCRPGDKMTFRLSPPEGNPYFGAFARRLEDNSVVWYFPESAVSKTVDVTEKNHAGVLSKGIKLGPEHPAGTYQVFGVFSDAPLSRDEIKALFGSRFEVKPGRAIISSVSFSMEPE